MECVRVLCQLFFVPGIEGAVEERLLPVAHLEPGERVLDVASGIGAWTRLVVERMGPNGSLTGLDLDPGIVQVAHSSTPESLAIEWENWYCLESVYFTRSLIRSGTGLFDLKGQSPLR